MKAAPLWVRLAAVREAEARERGRTTFVCTDCGAPAVYRLTSKRGTDYWCERCKRRFIRETTHDLARDDRHRH